MAVFIVVYDVSPLRMIIFVFGFFCFMYDIIAGPWMSGSRISSMVALGLCFCSICLAFLPVLAVIVEYPSSSSRFFRIVVMFSSLSISRISEDFTLSVSLFFLIFLSNMSVEEVGWLLVRFGVFVLII